MEKTMVLRKLMGALVFERDGKRIDMAPFTVAQFTTDEVKKLNRMNPELLDFPSDDEVELFELRNKGKEKAEPLKVDAPEVPEGPAADAKKPATKKATAKPAAGAADGPASDEI